MFFIYFYLKKIGWIFFHHFKNTLESIQRDKIDFAALYRL